MLVEYTNLKTLVNNFKILPLFPTSTKVQRLKGNWLGGGGGQKLIKSF